jgi:hypothetical protein
LKEDSAATLARNVMQFVNETSFSADLSRSILPYRDLLMAIVVVKASFQIAKDGAVHPCPEQLPISEADAETPLGNIDGDMVPIKPGCDLAILGHAHVAGGRRVLQHTIEIRIGEWTRRVVVSGERTWVKAGTLVRAADPQPFSVMPLGYDRAFGGRASTESFEAAFPDNPGGKGFVHLAEEVDGAPLPNIEEVDQMIARWTDRPLPGGLGPLPRQSAIRLARGADVDVENGVTRMRPAMFSFAHPRMMLAGYPAGAAVAIDGMTPEGRLAFKLPELPLWLEMNLGSKSTVLPLLADTLCVFPDYRRFFVLARRAVVYQFKPHRLRAAVVRAGAGATAAPTKTSTIAGLRAARTAEIPIEPAAADSPIPFELMLELNPLTPIVESLPVCPSE